jgi:site-specific DNA-cytosine methylase
MVNVSTIFAILAMSGIKAKQYNKFQKSFLKVGKKSDYPLSYISLFTGIGGFEVGIHEVFPNAKCLGYAEIQKDKIDMYEKNWPNHKNLGDIFYIQKPLKADLLVGGFSCKSKSQLSTLSRKGLCDVSFDSFKGTIEILKKGEFKHFILENVPTAAGSELTTEKIIEILEKETGRKIYTFSNDTCKLTGAYRKRIFFMTFPVVTPFSTLENMVRSQFNMEPYELIRMGFTDPEFSEFTKNRSYPKRHSKTKQIYNSPYEYRQFLTDMMNAETRLSRWGFASDSNNVCAGALNTKSGTQPSGIIVDRRGGDNLIRMMTVSEGERFLGFPKDYLKGFPKTNAFKGLGDSVSPIVVAFAMRNLKIELENNQNRRKKKR